MLGPPYSVDQTVAAHTVFLSGNMLGEYPVKEFLGSLNSADHSGLLRVGKNGGMSRLGARGDPRDAVQ